MRQTLDTFLRRRFFVVHLTLLALAALLLARTANDLGAHLLTSELPIDAPTEPATTARSNPHRDFTTAANANIFAAARDLPNTPPPQPQLNIDLNHCNGAPPSDLRLTLVGTVVFTEPASSLASIETDTGPAQVFSLNPCTPDTERPCNRINDTTTLASITPDAVCIVNELANRVELLALAAPEGARVVAAATPKSDTRTDAAVDVNIRRVGDNKYEVDRREVDRALADLNEIAREARIVPVFEGGKATGFKLLSMKPSSIYAKLGLQNGDIIKGINGYELSVAEGLALYTKLKDSERFTLDVTRRGKPQTLDYTITD